MAEFIVLEHARTQKSRKKIADSSDFLHAHDQRLIILQQQGPLSCYAPKSILFLHLHTWGLILSCVIVPLDVKEWGNSAAK